MKMDNKNYKADLLNYFSVIVIGDTPDEDMSKYDALEDTDKPYIIYEYSDVDKIRKNRIHIYEEFLRKTNDSKIIKSINEKLTELKSMSDLDYYVSLGELYAYDINKNIISTENPMGKWVTCDKGGRIFGKYLRDFNDNGVISAKHSEIDWSLTHMRSDKVATYNRTWELCVEKLQPENEKDKNIINNMRLFKSYFSNFKDKDEYIKLNCSFWTYAILHNGVWVDMENVNEFHWIINFFDGFIKGLSPDTLITIYECTK